jgi:transglutaminase-like putative cysteine protease/predicted esterase
MALILMACIEARRAVSATAPSRLWPGAVEVRLQLAGTNRPEISRAFEAAPAARRDGLSFLVENMPESDLKALSASFLLENLDLAYKAWETSPWRNRVTKDMFFNDVLPYASLTEPREQWRARLLSEGLPLIAGARSPGEAAQLLNQQIFPHFKVRYDTSRQRPDQSPGESIASGKATCTGLSILLVDCCRAVGIPARIVGTPMWTNMRGNHTWVEVWDGRWHFVGAAEPDPAGLDHGWFVADASQAKANEPQHAIYATSFKHTGVYFPLVWSPGNETVSALNVTDRYTALAKPAAKAAPRLAVKVIDTSGRRVSAQVTVTDLAKQGATCSARSRDETADRNDLASFTLSPGGRYHVVAKDDGASAETDVVIGASGEQLATLVLGGGPSSAGALRIAKPLAAKDAMALKKELGNYFAADATSQAKWRFPAKLERLLAQNEEGARSVAWDAFREAPIHAGLKANFDAKVVRSGEYASPYTVKKVGERPAKGWPLFIALHGGGGVPKEVNDSQWQMMQIYYKDHPEVGGYLYLALRAPNDTWNGFYDTYVYPLMDELILQFRLFGDIDPNKVFLMGYSHGGYGAYAIGPKMPDRFAAIHASAAAPTDGETTARTLRTTPFTAMVGDQDTMYGRYERNLKFEKEIEALRGGRTDIYPVTVTIVKGNGHTGLPDRDLIPSMYPAVRNPVPREVTWLMTDSVVKDFFWLRSSQPGKEQEISAVCKDNRLVITANEKVSAVTVLMDQRLVDFTRPVEIEVNGSTITRKLRPSLKTFCESLARRGDPDYAFSAELDITRAPDGRLVVEHDRS